MICIHLIFNVILSLYLCIHSLYLWRKKNCLLGHFWKRWGDPFSINVSWHYPCCSRCSESGAGLVNSSVTGAWSLISWRRCPDTLHNTKQFGTCNAMSISADRRQMLLLLCHFNISKSFFFRWERWESKVNIFTPTWCQIICGKSEESLKFVASDRPRMDFWSLVPEFSFMVYRYPLSDR